MISSEDRQTVMTLIEKGIPTKEIIILTFTIKAAKEMLDRAAQL